MLLFKGEGEFSLLMFWELFLCLGNDEYLLVFFNGKGDRILVNRRRKSDVDIRVYV